MKTKKSYSKTDVYLLAQAFNRSFRTIDRWIITDNALLSSDKAKKALLKAKKHEPEVTIERTGGRFGRHPS